MVRSPLNYTGGKFKLLSQILPLFPNDINKFVDLFCGGCSVGLNVNAGSIIYNDYDETLISMYETIRSLDVDVLLGLVRRIIIEYGLSLTSSNGYEFYGCESNTGLADFNREKYLKLRRDFNQKKKNKEFDLNYYLMFYVLTVYSFNNQIRFNSKGEFNLPVGKRDFNSNMEEKLKGFNRRIQKQNCEFSCMDYSKFDVISLSPRDFVYVDPPYLISCATYNEQGGWTFEDERKLLSFLDELTNNNIRFALSNVLSNKGKDNLLLKDWLIDNSDRYDCFNIENSFSNSSYQARNRDMLTKEVIVTNY